MMRLSRRIDERHDDGFSLIELVVVMGIFTMIVGIITASVIEMMGQTRKQTSQGSNLTVARNIVESLDTSVRYANDVTTPGTGTDGSYYVEWRTGNSVAQQTCTQWRYVPSTHLVQSRSWQPPLSGTGSVAATPWALEGTGVSLVGSTPIWSIAATSSSDDREELVVNFVATHGLAQATAAMTNQVTITAIDTASSFPLPGSPCTEVGRP